MRLEKGDFNLLYFLSYVFRTCFDGSNKEKGNILIYVLFVIAILSLLAIYTLQISLSDRVISDSIMIEKKAYYMAEAGIEAARYKFANNDLEVNEIIKGSLNDGSFEAEIVEAKNVGENEKNDDKKENDNKDNDNGEVKQLIKIVSRGVFMEGKYKKEVEFEIIK